MKKKYEASRISIEYFEMTQSIASCATKIGFLNSECVKKDPDATRQMKDLAWEGYFTAEPNGCGAGAPVDMDENDKYCYHTNANAAFNS